MVESQFSELFFPYDDVRPEQSDLILKVKDALANQQNLVVHAPTGLGKTAAALSPCIKEAVKKDLCVFFLTSRHTQHKLAMETVSAIKKKHNLNIGCVDIIGKKWLCLQPDVNNLYPREFSDYCKRLREEGNCEFYSNTRKNGEATQRAAEAIKNLHDSDRTDTESIIEASSISKLCPYEAALLLAQQSKVIIGDYYYIFHPRIRESFLRKIGKDLSKIIVVVDEGHNLPDRIKDLATSRLSTTIIKRAQEEAKKSSDPLMGEFLESLNSKLFELATMQADERYVTKEELLGSLRQEYDFDEIVGEMDFLAEQIRDDQKQSYLGAVATFLIEWQGGDEGFTRILTRGTNARGENAIFLNYRCLDPSIMAKDVIRTAHCTILMSGTLNPTSMYKELLGFDSALEATYKSPFPQSNRLNIIIPKTSTKYENRSETQFREMAEILAKVNNKIPGNTAVFFPSYQLMESIVIHFNKLSEKTVFTEKPKFTKKEKLDFLESFKSYSKVGAVLCGVIGGNFGEGVDLPGDYLKGVTIVGLPLQRPDLETEAMIKYYDAKFKKGWDYGYLLPAFNRALQSAGRCIRTETDKGAIIFLDERYAWGNYFRCFPSDWDIKITLLYERLLEDFFK